MSCEDFDAFDAEYGDRCAICGLAARETGHGFLNTDHDSQAAYWAVRGRLCASCNTRIGAGKAVTAADATYLADPWYRLRFAALGLRHVPEPVARCRRAHSRRARPLEALEAHGPRLGDDGQAL